MGLEPMTNGLLDQRSTDWASYATRLQFALKGACLLEQRFGKRVVVKFREKYYYHATWF